MADNKNPGYIEQLKEMRALRTQQLRGMNADQRFYANMNANQRALVQANQKLAASFDSMSKTFVSSLRGLTSAVGGLASKSASAAGGVASGVGSVAGSITSGLGKVLPFAIAGLVGKMLVWDNLTGENKNRLTSSVAKLFSNLFGDLPDMFRGVIQRVIRSVSEMDIKFPILSTLLEKTQIFVKLLTAGFELAKLKFEDLMEFFGNIKDPMSLLEKGMKAMGAATLARLLLPATVSLVTAIIANRSLMGQIGGLLDSRLGGTIGGGGGRVGKRARRAAAAAGGAVAISASRVASGTSLATTIAKKIGVRLGAGTVLAAIPVFGELLLAGYTAYELYEIALELGFTEEEADELSEPALKTDAMSFYGERKATDLEKTTAATAKQELPALQKELRTLESGQGMYKPGSPAGTANAILYDQAVSKIKEDIKIREQLIFKGDNEARRKRQLDEEKSTGGDIGVMAAFNKIWNTMSKFEKQSAIELAIPIIETENFVYLMGADRKIKKMTIEEYLKLRNELDPLITEIDRAEFERMTGKVIMKNESASNYNAFYGMGDAKKGSIAPPKNLTEMTGQEVLDYQERLRKSTEGKIGQGKKGTSAVGAYQLTKSNVTDPYYALFPEEKGKLFNQEQQDKIYRWFINDAVNQFMATGDKKAFAEYVTSKWEIFSKDEKARKELEALLENPVFVADAGDSTKKQTKEQRAVREKLLMKVIEQGMGVIGKSGDSTLMTYQGESVVEKGKEQAKEIASKAKDWLDSLIPSEDISTRAERFFNSATAPESTTDPEVARLLARYPAPNITVVNQDNSVKVGSASSGGEGSGSPTLSFNNSVNRPYEQYYRFNSLAGGNPLA